jgi:hypothetical protein
MKKKSNAEQREQTHENLLPRSGGDHEDEAAKQFAVNFGRRADVLGLHQA